MASESSTNFGITANGMDILISITVTPHSSTSRGTHHPRGTHHSSPSRTGHPAIEPPRPSARQLEVSELIYSWAGEMRRLIGHPLADARKRGWKSLHQRFLLMCGDLRATLEQFEVRDDLVAEVTLLRSRIAREHRFSDPVRERIRCFVGVALGEIEGYF